MVAECVVDVVVVVVAACELEGMDATWNSFVG
jgi:hypothetical protein